MEPKNKINLTRKRIEERVRRILVEQLQISPAEIELNSELMTDLGADSLDIVEVVIGLEAEFDITIPDEIVEKQERCTVKFIVDELCKELHVVT
jgi:acyl carrier protein